MNSGINIKHLLGKNLKKIRESKKLTQEKLAELINKNTQTLSRIETGRTFPSPETIEMLAEKLNISPALLFLAGSDNLKENKITCINDLLKELSKEQLDYVVNFVEFIQNKKV